jgi:hypothetical protein
MDQQSQAVQGKLKRRVVPKVPNFPTGSDHEDDTTDQRSGDAGALNLPILGLDHQEDGDNEIPSPSSYLNLDQHENEENATNTEHASDVNEEEENVEQALVDTLSASQVRCGHGLNKLSSGHFVITAVNEVGDPCNHPFW